MTYRHRNYVEECVRSVVSQQTNFKFEVLVRDDCSDDGTNHVLSLLSTEFPELKIFIEDENRWGIESPFKKLLSSASGQFLAVLEGDDFWTSTHKLQLCVQELQQKPQSSLVGHKTIVVDELSNPLSDESGERIVLGNPGTSSRGEMRKLHTSSMVMRREILELVTCSFPFVPNQDLLIKGVAAEAGETIVLAETMSAYRIHSKGSWSQLESESVIQNRIRALKMLYKASKTLRPELAIQLALARRSLVRNFLERKLIRRAFGACVESFICPPAFRVKYWVFLMALPKH